MRHLNKSVEEIVEKFKKGRMLEKKKNFIKEQICEATCNISKNSFLSDSFRYNVEVLDSYDFSEFLTQGRSLVDLCDAIEKKYDMECVEKYGIYIFEHMDYFDAREYFMTKYNIWFEPYTDWVVRHENGAYDKATRRT